MVVAIAPTTVVEGFYTDVALTGLTAGTAYDVYRLQVRYLGDDDAAAPVYERELPDRRALWSAVAHRVHWTATAAAHTFRDYEAPSRPFRYYVCTSASVGPYEWDFKDGDYPTSRGVLSNVVHIQRDLDLLLTAAPWHLGKGDVVVRSTDELGLYAVGCVVDMDGPRYTARGTELAVIGRQYPTYVADTRESRRGRITLLTDDVGAYNDLRRIVFPSSGRIRPVRFSAGGDPVMLLDDMTVVPLDVAVEQTTQHNADVRYLHIDYVEVDPSMPLLVRTGDNDSLATAPRAAFTISDNTPAVGQYVTLTPTATGSFTNYDWTIGKGTDNKVAKYYGPGPYKVKWNRRGDQYVKLRVYGGAGASMVTKQLKVH